MIKILICEDSVTSRDLMVHILNTDPEMQIIGMVSNGEAAVEAVRDKKPDVVIMDVHMPKMDGFEATRRIMNSHPVPIIVVSETLVDQADATFDALEAGALAFIPKPPGIEHPDHATATVEIIRMIKLMSEIKVVRRWAKRNQSIPIPVIEKSYVVKHRHNDIKLIAMGASTGGPIVLQGILSAISRHLNVPVLIVQHIAPGFVNGLVELLSSCDLKVQIATDGELMLPGHVYIAPEDSHMGIDNKGRIKLDNDELEHGMRPSISHLFRSVADVMGSNAAGILLTGMGKDGAEELKMMRDQGAITIVQDEKSSVVHGMPGEAIRLEAADYILSPPNIASMLIQILEKESKSHHEHEIYIS